MPSRDTARRTDASAPAARAAGRGATWLVLVAVLAVGALVGFVAGRAWTPPAGEAGEAGAAAAVVDRAGGLEEAQALRERILTLDPFVVNLLGDDVTRYLKLRIELEAESPQARAELEARLPQVRDGILTVLGTQDVAQATSLEGRTLLKRDLEARLNGMLRSGRVRSVLFTEYVVQ